MTAFASTECQTDSATIICELRSVNHRYCDISFKLPEPLRFLELDLHRIIASKIKRGKIECSLNYKNHAHNDSFFQFDQQAVVELLNSSRKIEALMAHPNSFSALEVLAFPKIRQEVEFDKESLKIEFSNSLNKALIQMVQMRESEGDKLKCLLEERCRKMSYYVAMAHQRIPEVLTKIENKLTDKISELISNPNLERLEQEIVYMIQKLDVSEELDRLNLHIAEVTRILQQKELVGRRLDFLMQEMNREANTLGAKSADHEMTQISIELKVLIEQMREQIQNIE